MRAFLGLPVSLQNLPTGVSARSIGYGLVRLDAGSKGTADGKTNAHGKLFFLDGHPDLIALFTRR